MSVMPGPDMATYPFLPRPTPLSTDERAYYREKVRRLLKERNAVTIAHYYTDPEARQLAEEIGGCIFDSLEMARFGVKHPVSILLAAGVRFMGETTKILGSERTILMPISQTECSLGLDYPVKESSVFCDAHPDYTVVVYASTSVAVKARVDWVITSSIAVELIGHLDDLGEKTIWAPDKHPGRYVQKQMGGGILCWQGACIVHDGFKTQILTRLQEEYPDAAILVYPESPQTIVDMTDAVDSTSQLIAAARALPHQRFVVATDRGIFYEVQQAVPDKELLEIPTAGEGATCRNRVHCPWIAMNGLQAIAEALEQEGSSHEVHVDERLQERVLAPLSRMLDFATTLRG